MIVGIISDTHGRVLPGIVHFLNACDEIFHAGDVTTSCLLKELRAFAPVTAVRGNNDHTMDTPLTLVRCFGNFTLSMIHDLGMLSMPSLSIGTVIQEWNPELVIHGHTHVPSIHELEGRLYVNPGSAGGWGRSGKACTVARLELSERRFALCLFEVIEERLIPFGKVIEKPLGTTA